MYDFMRRNADILSETEMVKMLSDYGCSGLGYYFAVMLELCRNDGRLGLDDLGVTAKRIGVEAKKLRHFVSDCINKYKQNNTGIFILDNNVITSEFFVKKNKRKKSGRKKKEVINRIDIEDIEYVNLEKEDYEKLKERFGEKLLLTAIRILDNWLAKKSAAAKKFIGLNHYGHFRIDGWVIQTAKQKLNEDKIDLWGYC